MSHGLVFERRLYGDGSKVIDAEFYIPEVVMSYDQKYTSIDGAWHAIGWSEHTQCGIAIPQGNGYIAELPTKGKAHCGPDTKTAEKTVDSDPVANKAVADDAAGVEPPYVESPIASDSETSAVKATKPTAKATKDGGKVA